MKLNHMATVDTRQTIAGSCRGANIMNVPGFTAEASLTYLARQVPYEASLGPWLHTKGDRVEPAHPKRGWNGWNYVDIEHSHRTITKSFSFCSGDVRWCSSYTWTEGSGTSYVRPYRCGRCYFTR